MKEESKKYTAFSKQLGHFEYNRMPFGLKNAPHTFQRMMDKAFQGLIGQNCFVYINDIVIFGKTIQENNKNMESVLKRICDLGHKLETTKCEYLKPELEYLGHIIAKDRVKPNQEKIEKILNFRELITIKDVQSFLSLSGYYRKFIKNFSTVEKLLIILRQKGTLFNWNSKCEESF